MNTKESLWVELGEFRVTAYDIAEEFAWDVRNHEQREKLDRTKRLSTGFPKPLPDPNKETARLVEKRFKDKYAANIRKNTKSGEYHLDGALAALGLITVKKYQSEHYVTMTDLGKEFYLLDNPQFNPNEEKFIAFYPDEVGFIRGKLIPQRELEDELCDIALHTVEEYNENDGEMEDQVTKLNGWFEVTIQGYIDDPNSGQSIHKERLAKDIVDDKKMIEACRVATMGRLSELGLIKWKIGPNTSSEYTFVGEA